MSALLSVNFLFVDFLFVDSLLEYNVDLLSS